MEKTENILFALLVKKCLVAVLILCQLIALAQVKPIEHGHAHNDYMHKRPLSEALENGFTSIEIDVFYHNNDLIVSHDATGLNEKPDMEALYLKPIKKIIDANGGTVYKGVTNPVIFMIDCKTGGDGTYNKLKEILTRYKDILAVYRHDTIVKPGPIQILISGNKPFAQVMREDTGFMTIDADISTINKDQYDKIITRYSDPWGQYFTWKGNGKIPAGEKAKLEVLIKKAHGKNKQIRFYHIPDKPEVWKLLLDEGVDWVNTDKLHDYSIFWWKYNALK